MSVDSTNGPDGRFIDQNGALSQLLVDSVVDYAIYLLDLDGTIKTWNAGAERIKGYRAEEIVGSNFSRFSTDEDIRAGAPTRSLEIARAVGRFEAQGWRVRKDGTRLWADVVIDVVRDPAGTVVGFAKVTRDLTQRVVRTVTTDDGSGNAAIRDSAGEVVGFAEVTRDSNRSAAVQYLAEQIRIEREQFLSVKRSADELAARAIASAEHDRVVTARLADQTGSWRWLND